MPSDVNSASYHRLLLLPSSPFYCSSLVRWFRNVITLQLVQYKGCGSVGYLEHHHHHLKEEHVWHYEAGHGEQIIHHRLDMARERLKRGWLCMLCYAIFPFSAWPNSQITPNYRSAFIKGFSCVVSVLHDSSSSLLLLQFTPFDQSFLLSTKRCYCPTIRYRFRDNPIQSPPVRVDEPSVLSTHVYSVIQVTLCWWKMTTIKVSLALTQLTHSLTNTSPPHSRPYMYVDVLSSHDPDRVQ